MAKKHPNDGHRELGWETYDRKSHDHKSENGAPGGIRTHHPRLRKPILYPNELRARTEKKARKLLNEPKVILTYHARSFGNQYSIQLSYGRVVEGAQLNAFPM